MVSRTMLPWIPAVLIAMIAGILDWRYRRIPNWLTVSGLLAGIAVSAALSLVLYQTISGPLASMVRVGALLLFSLRWIVPRGM